MIAATFLCYTLQDWLNKHYGC